MTTTAAITIITIIIITVIIILILIIITHFDSQLLKIKLPLELIDALIKYS